MDNEAIKTILRSEFPPSTQAETLILKKQTVPDTYDFSGRPLTGNRLNSGRLRSQFIVFENEQLWESSEISAKRSLHSDQRIFVQKGDDSWDVYAGTSLTEENNVPAKIKGNRNRLEELIKEEKNDLFANGHSAYDIQLPPHQLIFFGAPGTGKSNAILKEVDEKGKLSFRVTFHPDSDYSTFVGAYKPTMKENVISKNGVVTKEEQIVYRFVAQAFTKAYTAAWNTTDDVYLIIEEINRGNCAQIFGDLFQLLDRKNGVSQYPIDADTDLADYIAKELKGSTRTDFPKNVREGKKLMLPSNLYIWATMNTSDQSLFPIDSAFKRRWDWKYMKICKGRDENGNELDWNIKIKNQEGNFARIDNADSLSWWEFIKKINEIIASMTSSADKQLGFFFCKADDKGIINEKSFVSKVLFYLWNDVFKDYGFDDASLFTYTESLNGKEETKELTFPDFYDEDGENVNAVRVADFLSKVMNWNKKNEDKH